MKKLVWVVSALICACGGEPGESPPDTPGSDSGTSLPPGSDGGPTTPDPTGRTDAGRQTPPVVAPEVTPLDETCANALVGPYEMSMAAPQDVEVVGDDNTARFAWDGSLGRSIDDFADDIEGYRICWGPSESELLHAVLFTERRGQIFGVENGTSYVAVIQAVDKQGRVSPPSEVVSFSGDPTRVDQLASEMTGFFDDFNTAEGALNERRWNVAFSQCNDPMVSYTYVGSQQHALSVLGNYAHLPGSESGCDRDQNIARPRAVFDFGDREGKIVFDFDGAVGGRSTWYVDVFPYESEADLIDISGHVTFEPGDGHPGRFLRFSQSADRLVIHQHNESGEPIHIAETSFYWDDPDRNLLTGQLMRHWELRVGQNYAAIYIDGELMLENNDIDLDFERSFVHFSQFGYNPIKEGNPWHMFHWDNFGFDGPTNTIVTNNYKSSFNRDDRIHVGWPEYEGSWTVQIPDSLEGARSARFFYTIQTHAYSWSDDDHFMLNGQRFDIPEPLSPTGTWQDGSLGNSYPPFSTSVEIPLDALSHGDNTFDFSTENSMLLNMHIEVYFPDDMDPPYTQPSEILSASPTPSLAPIGPRTWINMINGDLAYDGSGLGINENDDRGLPYEAEVNQPLSGTVQFAVVAENHRPLLMFGQNLGVARLELLVDGEIASVMETAESVASPGIYDGPFEWNQPHAGGLEVPLDTTALANGEHMLQVRAYDSAGTVSRVWSGDPDDSEEIRFTVAN